VVRAEDDVLYLIGEPDCWGADDSSVLHSLFQFFAFDEGCAAPTVENSWVTVMSLGLSTAWYTA
jgi:hypothetical protein